MAALRNTIVSRVALIAFAAALCVLASINVTTGFRGVFKANDALAIKLNQSSALDIATLTSLREQQEALLIRNPFYPFAWMRLAYLRNQTISNRSLAFDALRFADTISQPDNTGGLDRILMWHDYADVHTPADKMREKEMLRTAYRLKWYFLYDALAKHNLRDVFMEALHEDPALLEQWQARHPAR